MTINEKIKDTIHFYELSENFLGYEQELKMATGAIEEITIAIAKNFAIWLFENRWFYYNATTDEWSYTHEHGTIMSQAEQIKHYIKKTSVLFTKFKIQTYG